MKKKILTLILLCFIPLIFIGCKEKAPLEIKNLSSYEISVNLSLEEEYSLDCKQKIKVYNSSKDTLKDLKFHLYPRAFSVGAKNPAVGILYNTKAYPNGESFGDISITKCFHNENEVNFYQEGADNDILVVPLLSDLEDKKYTDIYMEYTIKLPNINHRFGYGNNAINLGNFYPILCVYENGNFSTNPYSTNGDPFYSDVSNYKLDITYPSNYILAHSGILLENKDSGLNRTSYLEGKNIRDFAVSLSTKFQQKTSTIDDTLIKYYYYNDQKPEDSLKACEDSLKTFNELFGKYPYSELSVCETNFVYGGMEYPNLVFISDDIATYSDYVNTIIHEIAHQWWYGMVGNDEFSYGWLDEGLTEYSTALFYEYNPSYEITMKEVIENTTSSYLLFIQVYTDVFGNCNTKMNRLLNEYDTEPEYVYIAYVKAVLLMNEIRELIGKEDFLKGLKEYTKTYKGQNVTPDNLIECMEKVSKKPLRDIFYNYIDGKVIIMANE